MGKEYQSPKQVIQSYLEERAKSDPLFVTSYTSQTRILMNVTTIS